MHLMHARNFTSHLPKTNISRLDSPFNNSSMNRAADPTIIVLEP